MFCPKCGTPVPEGTSFCPKCSASISEAHGSASPTKNKRVGKSKKGLVIGIACAAAVILAAAITFVLILTKSGKDGIVGTWKTSSPMDNVVSILADDALNVQNRIVAFCYQDSTEEEILTVEEKIKALDGVESVVRITKAVALEKMKEQAGEYGDLYSDIDDENNPLSDCFEITYTSKDDADNLQYELSQIEGIRIVNSRAELSASLSTCINSLINADDELEMTFEFKDDGTYGGGFDEDRVREVTVSVLEKTFSALAELYGKDDVLAALDISSFEEYVDNILGDRFDKLNFKGSYTYEEGKLTLGNSEIDCELDGDTLTFNSINSPENAAENNPVFKMFPIVFTRS